MRILSITAQKPHSTGSGVYLTEVVRGFAAQGHEQAVIAGVYEDDVVEFPTGVTFYPAYFHTEKLPFAIPGMSDEMPYESTVYSTMTEHQVEQFSWAYWEIICKALLEFKPDLILCHHLFLLTAIAEHASGEILPDVRIVGLSHGSDLRQYKKSRHLPALRGNYIENHIQGLDEILALHETQKEDICHTFHVPEERVRVIGTGYNVTIFCRSKEQEHVRTAPKPDVVQFLYAGKLSKAKGVMSFFRSLSYLPDTNPVVVYLAGGYGSEAEYQEIQQLAKEAPLEIHFLGKISQQYLAEHMNRCDVFVLPSFYEGLPLVLMEAMACGMQIVATDLPGVQDWMNASIPDNQIHFVEPPKMKKVDEPEAGEETLFEKRLAATLQQVTSQILESRHLGCPQDDTQITNSLQKLSWDGICQKICTE